jgi:hypothetical protein
MELADLDLDTIVAVSDVISEAAAPGDLLAALRGEDREEFLGWWLPEQTAWVKRAKELQVALLNEHPLPEDWTEGVFPGWFGHWWLQVMEFDWAERLGEAVEAGELWLEQNREH